MRRFWYLRRSSQAVRDDVDEELRFHFAMRIDELCAQGWSRQDAEREAYRRFGDVQAARRYCQRQGSRKEATMQRALRFEDWWQDVRIASRALSRAPALTLTLVLTVALGIGATTVMFAAADAMLLRPLPYRDPAQLVWIYTSSPPFEFRFSAVDYLALQEQQTQFAGVAAFTDRSLSYAGREGAVLLRGRAVTPSYFHVLGITPALGRNFVDSDGRTGSPRTVLLAHRFWERIGSDPAVVGKPIVLDGAEYTVVGVLPPMMAPLELRQDVFVALQMTTPERRGPFSYWVIGRLKDGVDHAAAGSELHAINRRVFPLWKASYQDERATWAVRDLQQRLVRDGRQTVILVLAAVGLMWLIACVNASNLLFARVTSRARELMVRAALGAGRQRLLRHVLIEASVVAVVASIIGAAFAVGGVRLLQALSAAQLPRLQEIALSENVLLFWSALTVVSALVCGVIPAIEGARASAQNVLHDLERTSSGGRDRRRWQRWLVATQFAIATPLAVTAALLLGSLHALSRVDVGFDPSHLLSASIRLPASQYRDPATVTTYWRELERRLQRLAGVRGVAFSDSLPPGTASNINNFDLEMFPTPAGQSQPATPFVSVSPRFFDVMGVKAIEGRLLDERDLSDESLLWVVVDQAWSRRFFPNDTALGKRFKEGGCTSCPWTTVVGVVSNITFAGLDQSAQGVVYTPRGPSLSGFVLLRAEHSATSVLPMVRETIRGLDPTVPVTSDLTLDEVIAQALDRPRTISWLVGAFATVAVALSAVGIYGVMTYAVQQRGREISIRLALGSTRGDVMRMLFRQSMTMVIAGVLAGLVAAAAARGVITGLLFGVSASDPRMLAAVVLFLVLVAAGACAVPARRAIAATPAAVLRGD